MPCPDACRGQSWPLRRVRRERFAPVTALVGRREGGTPTTTLTQVWEAIVSSAFHSELNGFLSGTDELPRTAVHLQGDLAAVMGTASKRGVAAAARAARAAERAACAHERAAVAHERHAAVVEEIAGSIEDTRQSLQQARLMRAAARSTREVAARERSIATRLRFAETTPGAPGAGGISAPSSDGEAT